jgi:hypothetical protein
MDFFLLGVPVVFLSRPAFLSKLAFSMEHPVQDFHAELRYRNKKSPTSAGGRAF